jgi:excisionase family DNA binding protein
MTIQQPMLLGRTSLPPDESLPSLVIRLDLLNYDDSPGILPRILREGIGGQLFLRDQVMFPRRVMMFQRIASFTGVNITKIYASSNHHFAEVLTPPEQTIEFEEITEGAPAPLLAHPLAAKQLRSAHAGQFCPACLREAAYHRLVWMPLAVSACLEHRCLLMNRCQRCGRAVSIQDIVETRCGRCGGHLAETELIPLEDDSGLPFQHVLQSWFMENITPDPLHLLPHESPRVLYRVVDGLQWATRMLVMSEWPYLHRIDIGPPMGQIKSQRTLTPYANYCLYATVSKGMMNWPEGFYQFLDAYRDHMHRRRPLNGGPKADLGNLYTQWLQDYWQHPEFEFVHRAFEHYFVATYSLSSAVARTNLCREHTDMTEQLSDVSIAEAARLLGVTPKMIDILLRTGRLTLQCSGSTGKQTHRFVNRAEVLELRNQWKEFVNRAVAAEWLGITEDMIIDLVNVGLLVAERNPREGYPHWAFHKSALVDCMEKVLKPVESCVADKVGEKDTFVDLAGAARMLFVLGLNAASILSYVAEGKLQAYFGEDCDPKLTSLLFDSSDIQQCIQSMKLENGWVSREDVTKLLKVKDITLARWVKLGLLSPIVIHGSAQFFNRETVEKFIADHITTEEAAKLLEVGKLTVQKWARQGSLSEVCVSGPSIDGYHAYLFNKARLIQWRKERLPFGEAARLLGVSKATLHRWVTEGKVRAIDDMSGKQRWFSRQIICHISEPLMAGDNKQRR